MDATLWAYREAYKIPIGAFHCHIVYTKTCHLLVDLEHQAYWAVNKLDLDLKTVGEKRLLQLSELDEFRLHANENAKFYKEKTKIQLDKQIITRVFEPYYQVLHLI